MSGLEKFQATDSWRMNFKKLLFSERNPQPVAQPNITKTTREERFSLDIVKDLQLLVEEHKTKIERNNMNMPRSAADDQPPSVSFKKIVNICDDTVVGGRNETLRITDESFEAMERICDKTASDPNSTLFHYWHSEHKEEIVADAKKRSTVTRDSNSQEYDQGGSGEEDAALNRLLDELEVNEQSILENESPLKGVEMTQLEDIEEPSKFWDNTVLGETFATQRQTSPVKMVGLLRPSTIIEEYAADDSANCSESSSSQASYQSAIPSVTSEASCYETAHDTETNPTASEQLEMTLALMDDADESIVLETSNIDLSHDLIDLEETIAPQNKHANTTLTTRHEADSKDSLENKEDEEEEDNSVIELLSDNEEQNEYSRKIAKHRQSTFSDDNDKENCPDHNEKSLHFNDTMEEVEYMMRKGMEYMAAAKAKTGEEGAPLKEAEQLSAHTPSAGPLTAFNEKHGGARQKSPSKAAALSPRNATKNIPAKTAKASANRYALDMKPIPKLNIFKKPTSTASNIPTRTLNLRHPTKPQFSHIVSPIGTYMKKTARSPLITSIKCKNTVNAFHELEYESSLINRQLSGVPGDGDVACGTTASNTLPGISSAARTLPKKAYISSEYKHIVDERTPVTIPGGKSIQKYLQNAMLPAVVKHEGKYKMATSTAANGNGIRVPPTTAAAMTSHIPRRTDTSLADLSVMSGDVSMYTIKDAQKF